MNKMHKESGTPPAASTISTKSELKQVEERVAIGAHVVYETIRREGEEELRRRPGTPSVTDRDPVRMSMWLMFAMAPLGVSDAFPGEKRCNKQ